MCYRQARIVVDMKPWQKKEILYSLTFSICNWFAGFLNYQQIISGKYFSGLKQSLMENGMLHLLWSWQQIVKAGRCYVHGTKKYGIRWKLGYKSLDKFQSTSIPVFISGKHVLGLHHHFRTFTYAISHFIFEGGTSEGGQIGMLVGQGILRGGMWIREVIFRILIRINLDEVKQTVPLYALSKSVFLGSSSC